MHEQVEQFLTEAAQNIQSGQFSRALELADQAVALDPQSARGYMYRAIALSNMGQGDSASASFERSLNLNPAEYKVAYNFALHLYGLGDRQKALEWAERACTLDPTQAAGVELAERIRRELGTSAPPPAMQPPAPIPGTPPAMARPGEAPQPMASYMRSGYDAPVHANSFIRKNEKIWEATGWFLSVSGAGYFTWSILTLGPAMLRVIQNPESARQLERLGSPAMTALGYMLMAAYMVWIGMDISSRRGNWVWLVPGILCSCCGFGWIVLPIYMLAGRPKTTKHL